MHQRLTPIVLWLQWSRYSLRGTTPVMLANSRLGMKTCAFGWFFFFNRQNMKRRSHGGYTKYVVTIHFFSFLPSNYSFNILSIWVDLRTYDQIHAENRFLFDHRLSSAEPGQYLETTAAAPNVVENCGPILLRGDYWTKGKGFDFLKIIKKYE